MIRIPSSLQPSSHRTANLEQPSIICLIQTPTKSYFDDPSDIEIEDLPTQPNLLYGSHLTPLTEINSTNGLRQCPIRALPQVPQLSPKRHA